MKHIWSKIRLYCYIFLSLFPLEGYAQQAYVGDDDVSAVFISGGYGALFGAAMGAAILPFMNSSPMQNLRIVAGGASIGFMAGSAYGFYSLASADRNSYFNYNNQQDDENSYYSMPPTMPTHGNNLKNKSKKLEINEYKAPLVGALLMGDGKNVNLAVPCFWASDRQVSIMLTYLTF